MITKNKLDKLFGPAGTAAGIFMLAIGLVVTYFDLTGFILVLVGALVGFPYTSTWIDFENKRIKSSTNLFGILPLGKWMAIEPGMKIGIKKSKRVWTAYSRSNRTMSIDEKDYRLVLLDSRRKEIMYIQKANSLEAAKSDLEKISQSLGTGTV